MRFQNFSEKILACPKVIDPWPYQVVDDAINKQDRQWLMDIFAPLQELDTKGNYINFSISDLEQVGIRCRSELTDLINNIHLHRAELIRQYRKNLPVEVADNLITEVMVALTPPGYEYEIHDEHVNKLWTAVIYASPEHNRGTDFYTAKDPATWVGQSNWQQGSVFTFAKKTGVTWHGFGAELKNRITVNIFIKTAVDIYPEHLAGGRYDHILSKIKI